MASRLLRLLVPSPDRRRVLARPNGLAGWSLPVVPAPPEGGWSDDVALAAGTVVGSAVRPVREVDIGVWEVEALERVPVVGVTWIGVDEAGRLGADAGVVGRWAALGEGPAPCG